MVTNQLNATLHQMFEELPKLGYDWCNRQLLICWWAFWNWAFFIKFTKLMYYRLTFEIQCISSSQRLNFRMFISRWVTTCLITVWLKPCLRVVVKYVPFFFKHLPSMRGIDVLRVRVGRVLAMIFFNILLDFSANILFYPSTFANNIFCLSRPYKQFVSFQTL